MDHFSGGVRESKGCISIKIFFIPLNIYWLSWINISGPATLFMAHTLRGNWDSFRINLQTNLN